MTTPLQQIGRHHGTDKSVHNFKGVTYLDVYTQHIPPLVKCMVELGVYKGASLRTWREFFPHAEVWGVDIDPEVKQGDPKVITGSQADPNTISQVAPDKEFDFVVDDGSHLVGHIIQSFELIWPRVRSGGLYVVEDLLMTYIEDMSSTHRDSVAGISWPGQKYNHLEECQNDRQRLNAWLLDKIAKLDNGDGDIRSISFHHMMAFFHKA